jgi:5-methylcytosine-specific restriction endonuclease McrA
MEGCKSCGKELVRRQKTFCSRACRNKFHVKHDMLVARREKVCKVCGKAFLAYRGNKIYCSPQCLGRASYGFKKARMGPRPPRPQGKVWKEQRKLAFERQKGLCWLCDKELVAWESFDLHHTVYGDHAEDSKNLAALHKQCHKHIHGVTVDVDDVTGEFLFSGKAIDMLKAKGVQMPKLGGP